jgi:alkanesulfonate monooxygenase SsuD/methylene tetrahydromethanopterin reductase-like flavin-dependent oxidoreductase (luciferase family)
MKVWLFDIMFWPKEGNRQAFPYPGTLWDSQAGMDAYEGHLRYLQRADALGFDGVCLAEHHFAPYGICPSPNVMAGAVATHTSHARLVLLGNCLPLHASPVRMAEELAMVDVMSKGRLVAGFLRGGFTEWYAYSINAEEARGRFEESWDLIVKCWTEPEPFAWHGEYFNYENVSIMPRPIQRPHPPIIMPGSTAESLEWCARHRTPIASSFATIESMLNTFDYYRKYAREECGWTPGPEHLMVSRQVYVAPTNAQAREDSERYLLQFFEEVPVARRLGPRVEEYRASTRTERSYHYKAPQDVHTPEQYAGHFTYEHILESGYAIIGDPDYVTREIKRQQEMLGVGTFILYMPFSTMPLSMATEAMELFAKDVLPNLQD